MKKFYETMFEVSKKYYEDKTETLFGEYFSELRGKNKDIFVMSFKAGEFDEGECFEKDTSYFNASINLKDLSISVDCYESTYTFEGAIRAFEDEVRDILTKSIQLQLEEADSELNEFLKNLNIKPQLIIESKNGNLSISNYAC